MGWRELIDALIEARDIIVHSIDEDGYCPTRDALGEDYERFVQLVRRVANEATELGLGSVMVQGILELVAAVDEEQLCPDEMDRIIHDIAKIMARKLDKAER